MKGLLMYFLMHTVMILREIVELLLLLFITQQVIIIKV
jgi:hypothetical protein